MTSQQEKTQERGESAQTQQEMPFALVQGQPVTQLPLDLYIPPDALEVILEQFEGPLDLLLYLIKKQNLDVLDVQVADIVEQYMQYIAVMEALQLELAGEYMVMAAILAEIKSRVLLPRNNESDEEEEDPRAELIRRLQEYERFKQAAQDMDELPRVDRDFLTSRIPAPKVTDRVVHPEVDMHELMLAFADVLRRTERFEEHEVAAENLSMRERMSDILDALKGGNFVSFRSLFKPEEGRQGVVVTFLAMLELVKESLVELVQNNTFGNIHIKAKQD